MSTATNVDFRGLRVVVAHPPEREGERLVRSLQRLGVRVDLQWPPADRLDGDVAALFSVVSPVAQPLLQGAGADAQAAIVAIVDPRDSAALRFLDGATPHAVLVAPFDATAITASLVVALNNLRFQRRQLSKIARLEETLRSYRKVEQAKAILMQRRQMGEPEAYGYLRDQAMRRRVSIGAVAALVVESNEVLPERTQ